LLNLQRHKVFVKDVRKITFTNAQYEKYIKYLSMLLNEKPLPAGSRDHQLTGRFTGFREFHIGGDLVVVYKIEANVLQLIRLGSHSQLFSR